MCRSSRNTLPLYSSLPPCSETANVGAEVFGPRLKTRLVSGTDGSFFFQFANHAGCTVPGRQGPHFKVFSTN